MSKNQGKEKINANEEKCPVSPELDSTEFSKPQKPDEKYFSEDLSKDKLQSINEKKDSLTINASEAKERALIEAENELLQARSAHDVAEGKFNGAKKLLDLTTLNKKKQYWRKYHQSLREALPKNITTILQEDIEKNVPEDKRAILIAVLNQNLANLNLEYIKVYQRHQAELVVAENNLKLAMNKYEATICNAKA